MDNREAKFTLNAYRPGGQDASDPRFAEALEQARHDPILNRWLRESVAFDAAVAQKLRAVDAPADLRESILTGVKVSRPLRWTNRFRRWGMAAALILLAGLGAMIWHNTRPARLAGWQTQALDVVSSLVRNESSFDAQSNRAGELVDWLRAKHAPAAQKLPDSLDKLSSLGCKTFSWNGVPVSVICFMRPDGGLIHLVTTNGPAQSGRVLKGEAQLVQHGEWATATWREGNKVYMLALEGSPEQLRPFLS
jgi:hypothetical protein